MIKMFMPMIQKQVGVLLQLVHVFIVSTGVGRAADVPVATCYEWSYVKREGLDVENFPAKPRLCGLPWIDWGSLSLPGVSTYG